jgi:L,D-transpeptidase YcbB
MIRKIIFAFGVMAAASFATGPLWAEQPQGANSVASPVSEGATPSTTAEPPTTSPAVAPSVTPEAEALRKVLSDLAPGDSDEERNERAALLAFYEARSYAPLWVTPAGSLIPKTSLLAAEIKRADEWGLDPRDFPLPPGLDQGTATLAPEKVAAAEVKISLTVLKYGRYARGGRIINPAEQLSSYLDRRPQLLKPASILDGIAATEQPDVFLRGLNPPHPQFERLRQKYLTLLGNHKQQSAEAKKLLANMEEWRWMPVDMGDLYIWNNLPDFTQRVVKNGEVVRKERIVGGEVGKQTPIFTRPMRKITFKPTWIVPDSIKARELWPNMLRGGRLMREWGLEVRTKEGKPLDWRKMNWAKTDIREYEVIQPNGPKSVMGKVKFSFPNQHTVFMHDTLERDKWMFKALRRTYSHGCMRVANPIGLAEIVLREDKGWDSSHVVETFHKGPLNNEIALDHKIPVHMTYFTVLIDDDGKVHKFADVYGHERRISLALEGKWNQIVKGRDHLAPVELDLASAAERGSSEDSVERPIRQRRNRYGGEGGLFGSLFGGD